jgi:hypothetical protein
MKNLNRILQNKKLKVNYYENFLDRLKKINVELEEVKKSLPNIRDINKDSKTEASN